MGAPTDDRARHRLFPPVLDGGDLAELAGLARVVEPADHTQPLVAAIPAPRPAPEPPTEALPVVRHVVMPPYVERAAPVRRRPVSPAGRWGLVLGSVVVTVCTAYISVVGLGLVEERPRGTTSGVLTAPTARTSVALTSGPSASASSVSAVVAVTSRVAVPAASAVPTATNPAPVTTTRPRLAGPPPAQSPVEPPPAQPPPVESVVPDRGETDPPSGDPATTTGGSPSDAGTTGETPRS